MGGCVDPAAAVIDVFRVVMGEVYDPAGDCPPADAGKRRPPVRFFAGDGALPRSILPPGGGCEPLLWVRAAHRFRSRDAEFPAAFVGDKPCSAADVRRVLAVEVGVARCTSMEAEADWTVLHGEAVDGLDDSWRIETVLCAAASRLRRAVPGRLVATDTVVPGGPEGGIIVWTGMAYVQL